MSFIKQFFGLSDKTKRRNIPSSLNEEEKKTKKLHLVLDLDHTLLHTVYVAELYRREWYLMGEADSRVDLRRFNEGKANEYLIKLRPFLHEFLQEANKICTMYGYTMGTNSYARNVMSLIDPDKVYFRDRVITKENAPTFDLILSANKRRMVIVDDRGGAWPEYKRNLLKIPGYYFFRDEMEFGWGVSRAEMKSDEIYGELSNVLKRLQKAHRRFEEEVDSDDLRLLIRQPCCFCF